MIPTLFSDEEPVGWIEGRGVSVGEGAVVGMEIISVGKGVTSVVTSGVDVGIGVFVGVACVGLGPDLIGVGEEVGVMDTIGETDGSVN